MSIRWVKFRLAFQVPWADINLRIRVLTSTWYKQYTPWYWERTLVDRWKVELMLQVNKNSDKKGYQISSR